MSNGVHICLTSEKSPDQSQEETQIPLGLCQERCGDHLMNTEAAKSSFFFILAN